MSDEQSHLGGAYPQGDGNTFMPDVFGYLLVKYELKLVLDIGCGYGHTIRWFAENGLCHVTGIEGDPKCIENSLYPAAIKQHDFSTGPFALNQPYDLAWCAEVLEHIDEKHLPNVMPLFRLCRYACITHGEPGQAGYHHVNCQTTDYWIRKFAEYGFEHDAEETALLRRTDRWRAAWGRRTLSFFIRR